MPSGKQPVLFCWSGGKDSARCLHRVLESGQFEVAALLTTLMSRSVLGIIAVYNLL